MHNLWLYLRQRILNRSEIIIYRDKIDWLFDLRFLANRFQTIRNDELYRKGYIKDTCIEELKIESSELPNKKKRKR